MKPPFAWISGCLLLVVVSAVVASQQPQQQPSSPAAGRAIQGVILGTGDRPVSNAEVVAVAFALGLLSPTQVQTGIITGRLLSTDGQPATSTRVSAMAVSDATVANVTNLVSSAITDSAGNYRILDIPAGKYYVIAGPLEAATYYPRGDSINAATVLNVTAGSTVAGIDFQLTITGARLRGQIERLAGQVWQNPQVFLRADLARRFATQSTVVAPDGSFEFLKVGRGAYTLIPSGVGAPATIAAVLLGEADVTMVHLSGSVVVEGGGVPPAFTILFEPVERERVALNMVGVSGGTFRTLLQEGQYRIAWSRLGSNYSVEAITANGMDALASPLKISSQSQPMVLSVKLRIKP